MTAVNLAYFLLARIAEDEEWARPASGIWGMNVAWHRADVLQERGINRADSSFIARHDPARVLAECEAKRRIVELHPINHPGECWACDHQYSALQLLALPYSDHRDYRQEWAP